MIDSGLHEFTAGMSVDNAYRAIKKHSKYNIGKPTIPRTGSLTLATLADNIDENSASVFLSIGIHPVSDGKCKVVIGALNMKTQQRINPSPYAQDIIDAITIATTNEPQRDSQLPLSPKKKIGIAAGVVVFILIIAIPFTFKYGKTQHTGNGNPVKKETAPEPKADKPANAHEASPKIEEADVKFVVESETVRITYDSIKNEFNKAYGKELTQDASRQELEQRIATFKEFIKKYPDKNDNEHIKKARELISILNRLSNNEILGEELCVVGFEDIKSDKKDWKVMLKDGKMTVAFKINATYKFFKKYPCKLIDILTKKSADGSDEPYAAVFKSESGNTFTFEKNVPVYSKELESGLGE